jgi:hypothetical protein
LVGWSSLRRIVVRLANKLKQLKKVTLVPHFSFVAFLSPCPYIFYFLYFDIFEKYNVNVDSMRKINNDFEMNALIAERAENKFLNFELF